MTVLNSGTKDLSRSVPKRYIVSSWSPFGSISSPEEISICSADDQLSYHSPNYSDLDRCDHAGVMMGIFSVTGLDHLKIFFQTNWQPMKMILHINRQGNAKSLRSASPGSFHLSKSFKDRAHPFPTRIIEE
jgi:hypothetical protein